MSSVHESALGDEQLVRYLLGQLSDQEAEQVDEASIVDDDVAARLRWVEDDLVDSYANGTLTGESLSRFESHYLASPLRREKVRFAKNLQRSLDRAAAPARVEPIAERGREQIASARPAGRILPWWRATSSWM